MRTAISGANVSDWARSFLEVLESE
jgi:hypothetical protein